CSRRECGTVYIDSACLRRILRHADYLETSHFGSLHLIGGLHGAVRQLRLFWHGHKGAKDKCFAKQFLRRLSEQVCDRRVYHGFMVIARLKKSSERRRAPIERKKCCINGIDARLCDIAREVQLSIKLRFGRNGINSRQSLDGAEQFLIK